LQRLGDLLFRRSIISRLLDLSDTGYIGALFAKKSAGARLLSHLSATERALDKIILSLKLSPSATDVIKMRQKIRGRWVDVFDEGESLQERYMRLAREARAEAAAMDATTPDTDNPAPVEIDAHEVEPAENWNEN